MKLSFPFTNNRAIITLDQFLTNPTGKGSSMMARRKEIKADLEKRYYKLLKKTKNNMFSYNVYLDKSKYIFHFKIPSETFDTLTYDVILEFVPNDKKELKFSTINDYSINFFSNSPHMMFTYTYVLNQNNIIVQMLKNTHYSKTALTKPPKVTNPVEMFGFEKTCFFACMYINERKLYDKKTIEKHATKLTSLNRREFLLSFVSQEAKFAQYNTLKSKEADRKRKEKAKNKSVTNKGVNSSIKRATSTHSVTKKMATKSSTSSGFKSVIKPKTNSKPSMKAKQFKSVFSKKK